MANLAQNNGTNNTEKIETFLRSLKTEVEIMDYIQVEDIDYSDAFNSICDMISDNNGFDIEIIYYASAINYLKENDPSLRESLQIASEYGFSLDKLNSETLASLLASQNARDEFYELQDKINNFFLELETEEENND
jgi:intracellular sulfur oxidation DsrE/DsrF family protein